MNPHRHLSWRLSSLAQGGGVSSPALWGPWSLEVCVDACTVTLPFTLQHCGPMCTGTRRLKGAGWLPRLAQARIPA